MLQEGYFACALATQACDLNYSVRYYRRGEQPDELNIGRDDGSYREQLISLAKRKVMILDDWGMEALMVRTLKACFM